MEKFSSYVGVVLIIVAAIILMLSYFCAWTEMNWLNGGAILLMIVGAILHARNIGIASNKH